MATDKEDLLAYNVGLMVGSANVGVVVMNQLILSEMESNHDSGRNRTNRL